MQNYRMKVSWDGPATKLKAFVTFEAPNRAGALSRVKEEEEEGREVLSLERYIAIKLPQK